MTGMSRFVLLAAALGVACANAADPPVPAEPKTFAATEIAKYAAALPSHARFGIGGLGFAGDILYVGTNVGLIEVHGREVRSLHRWHDKFGAVEGPWPDGPRFAVWTQRAENFLRRDASGWLRVKLPKPPKGNYSRGDVLQGFTGVSTAEHFRVIGAGNVWRWNDSGWTIESMPPVEKRLSGVIGFGSVGNRNVYVVHNGLCLPGQPKSFPPCDYLAYWREGDRWREPIRVPVAGVSQVISTSGGVFLRSSYGELFRLDPAAATRMEVPSTCEAIARTSDGKLLASFKGAGVFELDREWIKRMEYPYSESEGEHRAYLSESHGTIALATSSVRHLVTKRGNEYRPTFTGTDALWISDNQKPRRVHLRGQ